MVSLLTDKKLNILYIVLDLINKVYCIMKTCLWFMGYFSFLKFIKL